MTSRDGMSDGRRWAIVGLVFVAIMLNYVDRQILALLKPTLEAEFAWSDGDYANMVSAFQFAAAFGFIGAGWMLDRIGLRPGFAIGVGVWSLSAMAHAFAASVGGFVAARVVLGASEAVGTPAAVKAAATYFPPKQRSIALGLANTAPNIGGIVTPLAIPAVAIAFGWQAAFLIAGGLGLLWVVAWLAVRAPVAQGDPAHGDKVPWSRLLTDRRTYALAGAKVLSDNVWFFMLSWLPDLFHRLFGLPQGTMGAPIALVFACAALGAMSGGWLPTRLLARGWSVDRARKTTLLLYACLILPVPLVLWVSSPWEAALLLGLGLFAHQGFSTNVFGFATDVFPASRVGSAIGLSAFCGNLGSIVMIQFSAWSLGHGYGYAPMLAVCAVSYLLALGVIQLLVPVIVPVEQAPGGPVLAH